MKQETLFDDQIAPIPPARRPSEPIVREALIEDGCRFWLKRAWGAGPMICWIMFGPSDADATRDDPTMLRVMEFSLRWGFGSCIVVNPIPLISSTPAAQLEWAKKTEWDWSKGMPAHPEVWEQYTDNIEHCAEAMQKAEKHVAAWGNNMDPAYLRDWMQCVAEATDAGKGGGMDEGDPPPIEFICLGTTKSGAPKHPLARGKSRVPPDFTPIPWKQT